MEPQPELALRCALAHTRKVLVDGFRVKKWTTLAVGAWLCSAGAGLQLRMPMIGHLPEYRPAADSAIPTDPSTLALGAVAALLVGLFALCLRAITLFLECRGAFVLVDGLVRDRAAMARPWRRYGALADEIYVLRLELAAIELALLVGPVTTGAAVLGAWAWLAPGDGAGWLLPALALAGFCGAFAALVLLAVSALRATIGDLVVPVMYARRCGVEEAIGVVVGAARRWPRAAARHAVTRLGLGLASFAVGGAFAVLFCCVRWIPFVDAMALLPVTVLVRSYGLHVAAQLADDLGRIGPELPELPELP